MEALEDVPLHALLWACKQAEKDCDYMPRPVKLRELAGRCPPIRKSLRPGSNAQIAEFTQQQCDSAKSLKWLKELAGEVIANTTIPGVRTELDIAKRKEQLRQQAQNIDSGLARGIQA